MPAPTAGKLNQSKSGASAAASDGPSSTRSAPATPRAGEPAPPGALRALSPTGVLKPTVASTAKAQGKALAAGEALSNAPSAPLLSATKTATKTALAARAPSTGALSASSIAAAAAAGAPAAAGTQPTAVPKPPGAPGRAASAGRIQPVGPLATAPPPAPSPRPGGAVLVTSATSPPLQDLSSSPHDATVAGAVAAALESASPTATCCAAFSRPRGASLHKPPALVCEFAPPSHQQRPSLIAAAHAGAAPPSTHRAAGGTQADELMAAADELLAEAEAALDHETAAGLPTPGSAQAISAKAAAARAALAAAIGGKQATAGGGASSADGVVPPGEDPATPTRHEPRFKGEEAKQGQGAATMGQGSHDGLTSPPAVRPSLDEVQVISLGDGRRAVISRT